jgi:hypothetical protein
LTIEDERMRRNRSQRESQSAAREGLGSVAGWERARHGARNIARNPASSRRLSHWNHRNSWQGIDTER